MRTFSLMIPPLMAAGTLFLTGCDSRRADTPPVTRAEENAPSRGQPQSAKAKQADFLNRIRAADPQGRTIDRALLNEQNELALVLDRSVELDKISALMKVMLTKMAAEFPGEDLTIVTYTPSSPPRKIGTAHLNARTRDMTYTPEQ